MIIWAPFIDNILLPQFYNQTLKVESCFKVDVSSF